MGAFTLSRVSCFVKFCRPSERFLKKHLTFLWYQHIIVVGPEKVVNYLVARRGRPVSENPKDFILRVRLDKETLHRLDECCEAEKLSRSEVVRKGLEEQHSRIKK